jgi:hypothetical protein
VAECVDLIRSDAAAADVHRLVRWSLWSSLRARFLNAVVTRDLPAGATGVGIPARSISSA